MSTSEILNLVIPTLLTAVIIPLLIAFGNAITKFVKTKTNNAKLEKYIDLANDAIITAVAETMQTFVTTLKNNGEWNADTAKKAFELAKFKAVEIMGAEVKSAIPEIVNDFDAWLTAKIEASTLKLKEWGT